MISLEKLSLRRGTQLLLDEASLQIPAGRKLGIIGRNGTGKTSLFKLLMGELSSDGGELDMPADLRKSQMLQETPGTDRSALDYVLDGDTHHRDLEAALARAEAADDFNEMARIHGELDLAGGYAIAHRAEQLLAGLGFAGEEFHRPVNSFSGGWRVRLNLAQALMKPSDLLLLDEPTNHLDIEAAIWLQQWLRDYEGTLLLISHDRYFLDKVVDSIVSFENKKLFLYRGNYSAYERQRAERLAQQQAAYEKQQQRKKEIENFVRRFRAKATKARQAQSRLKELERMEEIAPAHVDSPFTFRFPEPDKQPASLMACERLDIGYGEPLIRDFSLNITPDTRIGLLGPNGRGKSTLLKTLCKQHPQLGGEIHYNDHLRIGYCAQHQIDALDKNASPMKLIQRLDETAREQQIRDFLGGFDFRGDRVVEAIEHFSGGEKSRLALALIVWRKPNLLLLDEPTNHLDLEMCHALTLALQEFSGALLLVSHDQYLLSNVVNDFLLIHDNKLEYFDGSLEDYEKHLLREPVATGPQTETAAGPDKQGESGGKTEKAERQDKKTRRQEAAAHRKKLQDLKKQIRKLELRIEKDNERLSEIETSLADEALYSDENKERLNELLREQGTLKNNVPALEEEWLELTEQLENTGANAQAQG